MIESYYWKQHLQSLKEEIETFNTSIESEEFDEKICILEKNIIIGFLILRRLIESKSKVSDKHQKRNTQSQNMKLLKYWVNDTK